MLMSAELSPAISCTQSLISERINNSAHKAMHRDKKQTTINLSEDLLEKAKEKYQHYKNVKRR
ncbi:hypothetical protein AKJ63_02105 [candidate division MSBL1 archaeon SCGC-AAA259D18]|uniref:Uncharacterized protein n=1 Tax=candidate division MSBL1 archaeon SCGC-AAA259D18 TaxID=1698262 RepID=A0A133U9N6_9EURY|nr:hypothetical protein AKJ63_02105 [candidate division MSBL1 archaeon SCGC-AAA259D18]